MLTLETFLLLLIIVFVLLDIAINYHFLSRDRKELLDRIMSNNWEAYVAGKIQLQEADSPSTTKTVFTPPAGFEEV